MALTADQTILNGKYRILRLIGEGGMARVWLAEEPRFNNRKVAIKVPKRETLTEDELLEQEKRFRQEVELAAKLDRARVPHVISAHTVEQLPDGTPLLVMEFAEGGSLAERVAAHPEGMPIEQVVKITLDICRALQAFHDLPDSPVHRDVKPNNILFDEEGRAYLADYGLAQLPGRSGRSQWQAGPHPATPLYAAPEQLESPQPLTPAADLYALGCVLFEMLTGERYKRTRSGTRPSGIRDEIPGWLDAVILKALAEDPWDRFQSADSFAAALQAEHAESGRWIRALVLTAIVMTGIVGLGWLLLGTGGLENPFTSTGTAAEERQPRGALVAPPTSTSPPTAPAATPRQPGPSPYTATPTYTPTPTSTNAPTNIPTNTPTNTPSPTATATLTPAPTPNPYAGIVDLAAQGLRLIDGYDLWFTDHAGGQWRIWRLDQRSDSVHPVDFEVPQDVRTQDQFVPAVSPDGRRIAFAVGPCIESGHCNRDLYLANVDGTGVEQLTDGCQDEYHPSWSPDGTLLAYHAGNWNDPQCSTTTYGIWILNVETGQARQLTEQGDFDAVWSPSGRYIAYQSAEPSWTIKVLDYPSCGATVNSCTTWITANEGNLAGSPAWIDEDTLVFTSDASGKYELFQVDVRPDRALAATQLTENEWDDQYPAASNDGRLLVWQAFPEYERGDVGAATGKIAELYVMNLEAPTPVPLVAGTGNARDGFLWKQGE